MEEGILKVVDYQNINTKVVEKNNPLVINRDEISFTTCIEIPEGFKVFDKNKVNIKYFFNRGALNYVEFRDEIVAEVLNNITILNVKGIKLIGGVYYTVIINGFTQSENKDIKDGIQSFTSSGVIKIDSNLCYYLNDSNIDLEKLENLYKIIGETNDTFLFTQEKGFYKFLNEDNIYLNNDIQNVVLENSQKKYIVINSKVIIDKMGTTQ